MDSGSYSQHRNSSQNKNSISSYVETKPKFKGNILQRDNLANYRFNVTMKSDQITTTQSLNEEPLHSLVSHGLNSQSQPKKDSDSTNVQPQRPNRESSDALDQAKSALIKLCSDSIYKSGFHPLFNKRNRRTTNSISMGMQVLSPPNKEFTGRSDNLFFHEEKFHFDKGKIEIDRSGMLNFNKKIRKPTQISSTFERNPYNSTTSLSMKDTELRNLLVYGDDNNPSFSDLPSLIMSSYKFQKKIATIIKQDLTAHFFLKKSRPLLRALSISSLEFLEYLIHFAEKNMEVLMKNQSSIAILQDLTECIPESYSIDFLLPLTRINMQHPQFEAILHLFHHFIENSNKERLDLFSESLIPHAATLIDKPLGSFSFGVLIEKRVQKAVETVEKLFLSDPLQTFVRKYRKHVLIEYIRTSNYSRVILESIAGCFYEKKSNTKYLLREDQSFMLVTLVITELFSTDQRLGLKKIKNRLNEVVASEELYSSQAILNSQILSSLVSSIVDDDPFSLKQIIDSQYTNRVRKESYS